MEKRFDQWSQTKQKIDLAIHRAPFVSEGDVWWLSIGENIGSEISGKSDKFSRPAIIFKKLTHGFYLVVPTTTKQRDGSWYVSIQLQNREMRACLHQVRTIDYRRLTSKLGVLSDENQQNVRDGFRKLFF